MEEHCHVVALLPFMLHLACTSVIPVDGRSHDSFCLTCAVIPANIHTISGWVAALVTACLALGFAAFCFA
jgi:hypothetical protein